MHTQNKLPHHQINQDFKKFREKHNEFIFKPYPDLPLPPGEGALALHIAREFLNETQAPKFGNNWKSTLRRWAHPLLKRIFRRKARLNELSANLAYELAAMEIRIARLEQLHREQTCNPE